MHEFEQTSHANLYATKYSRLENQKFTEQFGEITEAFSQAMQRGIAANDPAVQELVRRHFEFCLQFWTPTKTAYISLATSYMLPSPYRDAYEEVASGLGKYHYDAIVIWANQNLE